VVATLINQTQVQGCWSQSWTFPFLGFERVN
jgi:hypothetical protein